MITITLLLSLLLNTSQDTTLCVGHYWTEEEAKISMQEFASEWNNLGEWENRASRIKTQILEGMQFHKMPEITGNFNAVIRNTRQMDGYIVENIAIESFPGFYITGNLYRPLEGEGKHAAILCPHGHLKDKRFTDYLQFRSAALARMGAVVFAYDMLGHGESKQVDHTIPIAMVLQTYNSKRVLEYLLSREDVDPDRVGMTGGSGGGTQTFLYAAIDDRIKVSVPVVQVSAHFFGGCVCESGVPIHKSKNFQTNNVEIAALCAPRPMLLVSDGKDWTKNTPLVEYPYIQRVYTLYKAQDMVENVHLAEEGHDYGFTKRAPMYKFMAKHLNLDIENIMVNGTISEEFIKILPADELRVFNEQNPRYTNELSGDEEVMKYLGF